MEMKTVGKYLRYGFYALLLALGYGLILELTVYPFAEAGNVLGAHIVTLSCIMVFLLLDIPWRAASRKIRSKPAKNKFASVIRAIIFPKAGMISFKTALYLYYLLGLLIPEDLVAEFFTDAEWALSSAIESGILFVIFTTAIFSTMIQHPEIFCIYSGTPKGRNP
jgi:hypothetical protein